MSEKANVALNVDMDTRVLREDELDTVSGGKVSHNDFVITKSIDKASPILFSA